ncbi:hypothetical protein GCM10010151_71770 [Actinoallomurus spadix]|uniref:Aminotransferase class I/classII domain-containing protein n=1 Tax=Actinoallomurus spadix TaxID=79912 RepID=A0ABN0XS58_9ACTN
MVVPGELAFQASEANDGGVVHHRQLVLLEGARQCGDGRGDRYRRGVACPVAQTALRHGVAVLPGSGLDASGGSREFVRIHFLAAPDALTEAVRRLATAWDAYGAGPGQDSPAPRSMAI